MPCLVLVGLLLLPSLTHTLAAEIDRRPSVLKGMLEELARTRDKLRMPDFEPPYFVAFEIKDNLSIHFQARYGAIYVANDDRNRRLRVETRVGSYEFDNVGSKTSDYDFSTSMGYMAPKIAPLDDDPLALRNSLWLVTDENYKSALKGYLKRKSKKVTDIDENKGVVSFSREKPTVYSDPVRPFPFARQRWEAILRAASSRFESHPEIFDSFVSMDATKQVRYLVNTEGSRIISEATYYNITIHAAARAADGNLLTNQYTLYTQREPDLPTERDIFAKVDGLARDLEALCQAPLLDPYTGPAILDGEATGVLFHEVVGHRLEGERQLDDEEGKTFKGQVGQKIIPEFLSVVDDPTVANLRGTSLNGFYRFDDEGVAAQKVVLIENGILKNFLLSRTPIDGSPQSNGHGRAAAGEKPRARMANTMVLSNRAMPLSALKKLLIAEMVKQDKPYGLLIKNIVGGSTHTSTWGYQAYKGMPQMVYRIFPDGREELVRGVDIVGTPIASINKIIATSDQSSIFNGFCGAESGYVPVSTAAPDVLMTEIEIQRTMKKSEKDAILPSPWSHKP